ncbi:MAG: phosphonate C-P lyase system protein PhnG [Desulfobacterota bacterium]|nr:phosphonate C-P lyase system protein PhnG [Thermodesulfobacteriota bacterium]
MEPLTRREWMSILAKADPKELEEIWGFLGERPHYRFLRPPETGLVMVRARAGGTGKPFNLGEVTVTRCTVQVREGFQGTAYVIGRNPRHAELAALLDALLQDPAQHEALMDLVIRRLQQANRKREARMAQKISETRVEFFTLVRGEDDG